LIDVYANDAEYTALVSYLQPVSQSVFSRLNVSQKLGIEIFLPSSADFPVAIWEHYKPYFYCN
jgi:hypothetical protein